MHCSRVSKSDQGQKRPGKVDSAFHPSAGVVKMKSILVPSKQVSRLMEWPSVPIIRLFGAPGSTTFSCRGWAPHLKSAEVRLDAGRSALWDTFRFHAPWGQSRYPRQRILWDVRCLYFNIIYIETILVGRHDRARPSPYHTDFLNKLMPMM